MSQRAEITDLTVCRALFAGWVFAYHVDLHAQFSAYLGPFANIIRHGYLGVDGFFILSGMILTRIHPELSYEPYKAPRFWAKRFARIYPVHLAVIVILAVLVVTGLVLGIKPQDPSRFGLFSLLENLLLIQDWGFGNQLAWNYPSWSVSIEWAGYLLFPLLWFYMGNWATLVAGQLLAVCLPVLGLIAFQIGDNSMNFTGAAAFLRFFPEFIAGMATMRLVPYAADALPDKQLAYVGLVFTLLMVMIGGDIMAVAGIWLLLASLMMQMDAERPPVIRNPKISLYLGRISYSFYMSFGTIEMLLAQLCRQQGWQPSAHKLYYAAAMIVLTLALAIILHGLVETPARRWADKRFAEPDPLASPSQAL